MRNKKAFTLIELMIVLTIITTLSLLAFKSKLTEKRVALAEGLAEELNWTLETVRRFYAINGRFPNGLDELRNANILPPNRPSDPFGGNIVTIVDNNNFPETFQLIIQNGIAATDYAGIIIRRVPFAEKNGNNIIIPLNAYLVWIDKEIAYSGIHLDGDVVNKMPCIGGLHNYPFITPVHLKSTDGSGVFGYKAWVTDTGNQYIVNCKVTGGNSLTEQGGNCYAWLIQICH